jgi:hypothetical protein
MNASQKQALAGMACIALAFAALTLGGEVRPGCAGRAADCVASYEPAAR